MSTSANGAAKSSTVVNGNGALKAVPATTPQAETPAKNQIPPIQKRLDKFKVLSEVLERREKVADALEDLTNFYIAPTGAGCSLKLSDSKGNTFAIAHPSVIGEMVSLAKEKMQAELDKIDNDFNFDIN